MPLLASSRKLKLIETYFQKNISNTWKFYLFEMFLTCYPNKCPHESDAFWVSLNKLQSAFTKGFVL